MCLAIKMTVMSQKAYQGLQPADGEKGNTSALAGRKGSRCSCL